MGYIIGIIIGLYFKKGIAVFLFLIILCYKILTKLHKTRRYIKILIPKFTLIIFLISIFISCQITISYENKFKEKPENMTQLNITCVVKSQVKVKEHSTEFIVEVIDKKDKLNKMKLLVDDNNKMQIQYGDILKISGKFQEISSYKNPGVFNYQQSLKKQKIIGNIKIQKIEKIGESNNVLKIFSDINKRIKNKIENNFSENTSSILKAIVIGDKENINEEILTNIQDNGLSHIIAISGMHISCIVLIVNAILNKFIIDNRKKKIILIISLVIFIFIIGFIASAVRATIMTILMILSKLLFRKNKFEIDISIASLVILIYNPYYLIDAGFLLSFGATIGIMLIIPKLSKNNFKNKVIKYCIQTFLISVSVNIFILPITIIFFKRISITGIITSVLISPFVFIIEFLGIITIFLPTKFIYLIKPLVEVIVTTFIKITQINIGSFYLKVPTILEIIVYYLIFICILNKKIKKYFKIPIATVIIAILISKIDIKNELKIYFVDVEQGDCTLIQTENNKTILIDGGGNTNSDIGKNVLIPYLLNKKINYIDYVIISHFDTDHVGGILTLLETFKTSKVIIGKQYENSENLENFINIINKKKIETIIVKKGDRITLDDATYLDILWPDEKNIITSNLMNNESLICKLNYNNFSMLFSGDIEKEVEEKIIKDKNAVLKSDILKVAHHGSKTSSTQEFIKKVQPKISLIGVGQNNKFGHPSYSTLENLKKIGSIIYRTDINGEITIMINKSGKIKIKKYIN